ncbi:hypothetical protein ACI1US_02423 [Leucobacter sp. BZR 635]
MAIANTVTESAPAHVESEATPSEVSAGAPQEIQRSAADRFMRSLLRVEGAKKTPFINRDAHRNFRVAIVISGIRCLITYLLIPILVPVLGFAGVLAAPLGIALCLVAVVNGVVSVRRFWISDHRGKWMYTWFIVFVFAILAVAMYSDIASIVSPA